MFYYQTPYGQSPIFAYRRGEGYSFYSKTKHGEKFICWLKGGKEEVSRKMDKKFDF
jgi:hypothetical protein